jgi:SnoaL-like domain
MHDVTRSLLDALAAGSVDRLAGCYTEDARSFGPLSWPSTGSAAIAADQAARVERLGSTDLVLHDEFTDAAAGRLALRFARHWVGGMALESRYLRLDDERRRIVEEFVGPNTFQLADLEVTSWGATPATTTPDPAGEVIAASVDGREGKEPETTPERFVDAFGRGDPEALLALYHPRFVLYSPIAWGLAGTAPLASFVEQFQTGFPGIRLALHDQFTSADGSRIAFRFSMRFHNTAAFFGHPATGRHGVHAEFHSLRLDGGRITEQVVTDISYGIPYIELTEWKREYPTDTPDPSPPHRTPG